MEAVGRLAAGVAHDFNNILTVILGNTSMQLRNPHLDEKLRSSLHQVERAAERATGFDPPASRLQPQANDSASTPRAQ